jgi:amino acid transporter
MVAAARAVAAICVHVAGWGAVGGYIAQVLLVTSLFAALLSFPNVLARYFFVLGASGALPATFGSSHQRHGSPHVGSLVQTVSALVLLLVFVVAGMGPVTQVFSWMAGAATLGVLTLMALTCLAVLVYFRRSQVDHRLWHTVAAPALGLAGLLTFLGLTITNFPTLIGGSAGLATAIGAVLVVFFAVGAAWSARRSALPSVISELT